MYKCPKCGGLGPFEVTVVGYQEIDSEGNAIDHIHDSGWDPDSECTCSICHYTTLLFYFDTDK